MKVYRIAKYKYIHDLSGEGARIYGGRWNNKGINMLYTASNRSLATVEYLVHLPIALVPEDIYIVEIIVPDESKVKEWTIKDLPRDWSNYPAPFSLATIGDKWVNTNQTLLLKVPSSVVKGEYNILINPKHKLFNKVKINSFESYDYDNRLLK
ncbi:MAG: RES family NAD+ phosphorylase [Alcanivoracaceae bacterium]|nr:RES family NAD+ phosphorylase [Alcanivoracaceae bacterium]